MYEGPISLGELSNQITRCSNVILSPPVWGSCFCEVTANEIAENIDLVTSLHLMNELFLQFTGGKIIKCLQLSNFRGFIFVMLDTQPRRFIST